MSDNEYSILSNKEVGMSKSVFVEYNPNDFFYAIANKGRGIETPSKEQCDTMDIHDNLWDDQCSAENFQDNYKECIERELCINKEEVDKIKGIQNRHNGSDEKFANTNVEYGGVVINTINLGIGILLLMGLIYRFRNK